MPALCRPVLSSLLAAALISTAPAQHPAAIRSSANSAERHTAGVNETDFLLDGKPFEILSGEMHYARIPRAAWPDRLAKLKALGLNSVTTYVFWNVHEPTPGHFDFSGQNDVAAFIREAQRAGLFVILRPGPYACAEWELGGYPAWLLKDPTLVLRTRDPKLTAYTERWFTELGKQIQPLLLQNGGPILATQVENEYGSFGDDHEYMELIHSMLVRHGLAAPILYTADGPKLVPKGSLPELPAVINFGTGEARSSFADFATIRPTGPRMSGEYWAGWFDHWGDKHQTRSAETEVDEITWMASQHYSMSLYMGDGGTSFGWMNGANSNGINFEPDTTSYDYDAPISEDGDLKPKYFAIRSALSKVTGNTPPEPPAPAKRVAFTIEPATESASLWDNLPQPRDSATPLPMEQLDQNYGYILYRASLPPGPGGELVLNGLKDFAQVYLDRRLVGTVDRRLSQDRMSLPSSTSPRTLDLLVENSGRVNYTVVIRTERKGISGPVTLAGTPLGPWKIYSLPFAGATDPATFRYADSPCTVPCLFRKQMRVSSPADTYLDLSGNTKGFVWINGTPLGRFWSIGPQYSLWTPASWLHPGENSVILFDLQATGAPHLSSVTDWVEQPSIPVAATEPNPAGTQPTSGAVQQ